MQIIKPLIKQTNFLLGFLIPAKAGARQLKNFIDSGSWLPCGRNDIMNCRVYSIRNNHGFTWVELIVVMVIMGIISAVVGTNMMRSDTELIAQTEVVKTHLRYAQARSMNSDSVWYIQFSGNSYALYKHPDVATPIRLPGGDSSTITLPGGLSINHGAWEFVSFDGWGKPCTDNAGSALQAADRILTVSDGSGSREITITKNTGFIQ